MPLSGPVLDRSARGHYSPLASLAGAATEHLRNLQEDHMLTNLIWWAIV
jgi:hypothetical protein